MSHLRYDDDDDWRRKEDEALRRIRENMQNRSTPVHLDDRHLDKVAEDFRREQKGG